MRWEKKKKTSSRTPKLATTNPYAPWSPAVKVAAVTAEGLRGTFAALLSLLKLLGAVKQKEARERTVASRQEVHRTRILTSAAFAVLQSLLRLLGDQTKGCSIGVLEQKEREHTVTDQGRRYFNNISAVP